MKMTMNQHRFTHEIDLYVSGTVLPGLRPVPVRGEAMAVVDPGFPPYVEGLTVEVRNHITGDYHDITQCISDSLLDDLEQSLIADAEIPF